MSHPKVCPCPNCIASGAGSGRLLGLAALGLGVWGVVEVSQFSARTGRGPFLVIGLVATVAVLGLIVLAIVGAIRAKPVVAETSAPRNSDITTKDVIPDTESQPIRLVARDGRRVA